MTIKKTETDTTKGRETEAPAKEEIPPKTVKPDIKKKVEAQPEPSSFNIEDISKFKIFSERKIHQFKMKPEFNWQIIDNNKLLSSNLDLDIAKLRADVTQKFITLFEENPELKKKDKRIKALEENLQDLQNKEKLAHLLQRVGPAAQDKLLKDKSFRDLFETEVPCNAFVVSIDIRRSTELMLKSRQPKLFAKFIVELTRKLRDVVLNNYGVFDKFTGDGILAFFPEFYSGPDAGYLAIKSAIECHKVFSEHYEENRHCFFSVLKDIGLGIGVDYGQVQIIQIGGDFTVVGTPVVYACRMGGALPFMTYVNQPAYEQLFDRYAVFDFITTDIEIKNEGKTLAYSVCLNGKNHVVQLPEWANPSDSSEGATNDVLPT